MKYTLSIFTLLMLVVLGHTAAADRTDTVTLIYRVSKTQIDSTYMGNADAMARARQEIERLKADSALVLDHVHVTGAASPEGPQNFNEYLSRKRAENIFQYVGDRYQLPDSLTSFTFLGSDWQGLRRMVIDDPNVPHRDAVLSMLDDIVARTQDGDTDHQQNLDRIKHLNGGVPYRYMLRHLFPALRASKVLMTFSTMYPPLSPLTAGNLDIYPSPLAMPVVSPIAKTKKPFYMALKTNMLFDLLATPEIGAEFYLGKNISVVGNWWYGWWKTDPKHRYWRNYGGDLAVRWWFGRKAHDKPLTGHHVGLYGGVVTYDFEWGGTGYMGGHPGRTLWDRCNWFCGAEYGYSMPIARRFNIDFTLGLGYLRGKYVVYDPEGSCYVWKKTKMRNWIGPTKAEISLVWLIGRGNYNKKGGEK